MESHGKGVSVVNHVASHSMCSFLASRHVHICGPTRSSSLSILLSRTFRDLVPDANGRYGLTVLLYTANESVGPRVPWDTYVCTSDLISPSSSVPHHPLCLCSSFSSDCFTVPHAGPTSMGPMWPVFSNDLATAIFTIRSHHH